MITHKCVYHNGLERLWGLKHTHMPNDKTYQAWYTPKGVSRRRNYLRGDVRAVQYEQVLERLDVDVRQSHQCDMI